MKSLLTTILFFTFAIFSVFASFKQERRSGLMGQHHDRYYHHCTNRNSDRQPEHAADPPKPAHRVTNAERFAQGLPPLPPRNLFRPAPSRQDPIRPRVSNVALGRFRIHVYDSNGLSGASQGYVGSTVDSMMHYPLVTTAASGVIATYDNNGAIKNTAVTVDHAYLGFINPGGSTNDNDKEGGWLSATNYAPPGSPPQPSPDQPLVPAGNKDTYETAVWSVGSGNELIATWYDQSGKSYNMVLLLVQGDFLLVEQTASVAPNLVRFFAEAA